MKASPLARRVAHETGIELRELTGTGPGGRIVKSDVEKVAGSKPAPAIATADAPPTTADAPSATPSVDEVSSAKGETTTVELSRTQRTIARRMAESKATIPDFTLSADIDMERCVDLRAELKRLSRGGDGRDKADVLAVEGRGQDRCANLQRHDRQGLRLGPARPSSRQRQLPRRALRAAHTGQCRSGGRRRAPTIRQGEPWSSQPCSTPTPRPWER